MIRKTLSCALAASLLLTGAGVPGRPLLTGGAWAGESGPPAAESPAEPKTPTDPYEAQRLFNKRGIFTGPDDPNLDLFRDPKTGFLTPAGEVLYQYMLPEPEHAGGSDEYDEDMRVRKLRPQLEAVREAAKKHGAPTEAMRKEALKRMGEVTETFKKVPGASAESKRAGGDTLELGRLLNAAFDGFAAGRGQGQLSPDPGKVLQARTDTGWVLMDKDGIAARINRNMLCRHKSAGDDMEPEVRTVKQFLKWKARMEAKGRFHEYICTEGEGATLFSREILNQQKMMNRMLPDCMKRKQETVPETGRYNYMMVHWSRCAITDDVKQLHAGYRKMLMTRIARLLGGKWMGWQPKDDPKKMKELRTAAENISLGDMPFLAAENCPNQPKNLYEYELCKVAKYKTYLDEADVALAAFGERAEGFRHRNLITDADIKTLGNFEINTRKYVTLAWTEAQYLDADNLLGMLGHDFDISKSSAVRVEYAVNHWLDWKIQAPWNKSGLRSPIKFKPEETPESKFLRDAIEAMDISEKGKKAYWEKARLHAERLGRLMAAYKILEEKLEAATPDSGEVGRQQGVLRSAQEELIDSRTSIDFYLRLPLNFNAAYEVIKPNWIERRVEGAVRWFAPDVKFRSLTSSAANIYSTIFGDGQYQNYRADVDNVIPYYRRALALMAEGKPFEACDELRKADPKALSEFMRAELNGRQAPISDWQRCDAVARKSGEAIKNVVKIHGVIEPFVSALEWSFALGTVGQVAGRLMIGPARWFVGVGDDMVVGAQRMTWGKFGIKAIPKLGLHVIGFTTRGLGLVLENTALRLVSLGPTAVKGRWPVRLLKSGAIGTLNSSVRIGGFMSLAGGLSGVISVVTPMGGASPLYNKDSPFYDADSWDRGAWNAFRTSSLAGAKWASESWHPLILFAGLPANMWERYGWMENAANSLATRGVLGNLSAVGQSAGRGFANVLKRGVGGHGWDIAPRMAKISRVGHAMMEEGTVTGTIGGWGKGFLSLGPVQMLDHVAKYMVIGYAAKYAGERLSYWRGIDGHNYERRLLRAQQVGLEQQEADWWLLLPQFSAKYEMEGYAQQLSQQGALDYSKAGEGWRIANAFEGQYLPMKGKPKINWMEALFNARFFVEKGPTAKFRVSTDMKFEAIKTELPGILKGAKPGVKVDPLTVNPIEYLNVANGNTKHLGRLQWSKSVADQAHLLFEEGILANPKLALRFLNARPGSAIGEHYASYDVQEAISRTLMKNQHHFKYKVSAEQLKLAEEILGPNRASELKVKEAARAFYDAANALGKTSEEFQNFIDAKKAEMEKWEKKYDSGDPSAQEYVDVFENFRREAQGLFKGTKELKAFESQLDFLFATRKRLQWNNTPESASAKGARRLEALLSEARARGADPLVIEFLKTAMDQVQTFKAEAGNQAKAEPLRAEEGAVSWTESVEYGTLREYLGERAARPGGADQAAIRGLLEGGIKTPAAADDALKAVKRISGGKDFYNTVLIERAMEEVRAAPWMVRDAKGVNIADWRPGQIKGLFNMYATVLRDGAESARSVRQFMLAATGLGKTIMAFEGMLPYVERLAVAKGKTGGVVFLTTNSNLLSQARNDFRSMLKIESKLEFDTYEGFKSKLAQGEKAQSYMILADEMDGAALQAALTLGMEAGVISRDTLGYKMLKDGLKRIEEAINRGPDVLRNHLETAASQMRTAADKLPVGKTRGDILETADNLSRMARRLNELQIRRFPESRSIQEALSRLKGELARLRGHGNSTLTLSEAARLEGLVKTGKLDLIRNRPAKPGDVARLENRIKRLGDEAIRIRRVIEEGPARIESLLDQAKTARLSGDARAARRLENKAAKLRRRLGPSRASAETARISELEDLILVIESSPAEARSKSLERANRSLRQSWVAENQNTVNQLVKEMEGGLARQTQLIGNRSGSSAEMLHGAVKDFTDALQARESLAQADRKMAESMFKDFAQQQELVFNRMQGQGDALAKSLRSRAEAARKEGRITEAKQLRVEADKAAARVAEARAEMTLITSEITHAIEAGTPGWEGEVRSLLARGEPLIEVAVLKDNAAWGTWKQMLDSMYIQAHSSVLGTAPWKLRDAAPLKAARTLLRNGREVVVKSEGLVRRLRSERVAALRDVRDALHQVNNHNASKHSELSFEQKVDRAIKAIRDSKGLLSQLDPAFKSDAVIARLQSMRGKGQTPPRLSKDLSLTKEIGRVKRALAPEARSLSLFDRSTSIRAQLQELRAQRAAGRTAAPDGEIAKARNMLDGKIAKARRRLARIERNRGSPRRSSIDVQLQNAESLLYLTRRRAAGLEKRAGELVEGGFKRSSSEAKKDGLKGEFQDEIHENLMRQREGQSRRLDTALEEFHQLEARRDATPEGPGKEQLKKKADAKLEEVEAINDDIVKVNAQITRDKYELYRNDFIQQELGQLQKETARFAKEFDQGLGRLGFGKGSVPVEIAQIRSKIESLNTSLGAQSKRLDWTPERAHTVLTKRIYGIPTRNLLGMYAVRPLRWPLDALYWTGRKLGVTKKHFTVRRGPWREITRGTLGESRYFSRRLAKDIMADPFMPPKQKWELFSDIASGTLFPGFKSGSPKFRSYVTNELYNLASAYRDPHRAYRFDGITKKVVPIHNGEPSPTMDTPTRRAHEIWNNVDISLKYAEGKLETYDSIVANQKTDFIGFSGTEGEALHAHHVKHHILQSGLKPTAPDNVGLSIHRNAGGRMEEIANGARRVVDNDVLQLSKNTYNESGEFEFKYQADGVLINVHSDTMGLRQSRSMLLRKTFTKTQAEMGPYPEKVVQGLRDAGYSVRRFELRPKGGAKGQVEVKYEIALSKRQFGRIFTGGEELRLERPQANVEAQMNTEGIARGTRKVQEGVGAVMARGVDLPWKGKGIHGTGENAPRFRGYHYYEMQIHDPHLFSPQGLIQIEGRIAPGRTPKPSSELPVVKRFTMVMDMQSAGRAPEFQRLWATDPIIKSLREHRLMRRHLLSTGRTEAEWGDVVDLVRYMESTGDGIEPALTARFHKTVENHLGEFVTKDIEEAELRSAQVGDASAGAIDHLMLFSSPVFPAGAGGR